MRDGLRQARTGRRWGLGALSRWIWRAPVLAVVLAAVLALGLWAAPAEAQELRGEFRGIDAADGFVLQIRPRSGGFTGVMRDPQGRSGDFTARRSGGDAEGVLEIAGERYMMRISPAPAGVQVVVVPILPNGDLSQADGAVFAMIREDLELPPRPDIYVDPPTRVGEKMDPVLFLHSYAFWPPSGVGVGYHGLPPRFRTLARLFPLVHADMLWKMCQDPGGSPSLGEALRGQGVSCSQLLDRMRSAQRGDGFDRFKRDVAVERLLLLDAVRCGQMVFEPELCKSVARRTSQAAINMETAASVLARYR